jgi:hypothetical protein
MFGVLVGLGLFSGTSAEAQTASGSPPPTYDFDAVTPGTQPPTSPLLAGYDYRSVRTYQVSIPVLVPLSQLQAIMPPGFTAQPSAPEARTATLSFAFFVDQRFERTGVGESYGPVTALLVSTTATNNNVNPARSELVFPAFEASGDIDAVNASFGPGSARLAKVQLNVEQRNGKMRFRFEINDARLGFRIVAAATSPVALNNRLVSDPVGLPFRTFNGFNPNAAFRAASQSDALIVPTKDANLTLRAPGKRLRFPAGRLTIVGVGPSITFSRNVEFFVKFE